MAKELLSYTCPVCGKVITSLYQRQLDQNKKQHEQTHVECVQKVDQEAKKE